MTVLSSQSRKVKSSNIFNRQKGRRSSFSEAQKIIKPCWVCESKFGALIATGLEDWEYCSPGVYDLMACNICKMAQLIPVPTSDILKSAYPDHYHTYQPGKSRITNYLKRHSLGLQAKYILRILNSESGNILDVGCSDGALLIAVGLRHAGLGLYGIESHEDCLKSASSRQNLKIYSGFFESVNLPIDFYDIVIMNHVLEHLYAPGVALNRVLQTLKPGGFFVGELPNIDSWDFKLFGRFWGGGHAPRHLWHFSPENLAKALTSAGFTDIKIMNSLHTGHWAMSVQNTLRGRKSGFCSPERARDWYYPYMLILFLLVSIIQFIFSNTGVIRFEARKSRNP